MKYNYKISYTSRSGKRISISTRTKKEAESGKAFREKLNKKSISFGMKPTYKNLRISKRK